jgi:hypothetical protein
MADSNNGAGHASIAGVSAGTTFVGIFSQLGDGPLKTILLLLAPTITIVVGFFWNSLWSEIQQLVAVAHSVAKKKTRKAGRTPEQGRRKFKCEGGGPGNT